jgi:hypothetical protein
MPALHGWSATAERPGDRVTEHVRIRKIATRSGRPEMLDDGHVVEGDELSPPTPGMPYAVRRTVSEHADAPDVFATSPVRAVITEQRGGGIVLLTDNSKYAIEVVGR